MSSKMNKIKIPDLNSPTGAGPFEVVEEVPSPSSSVSPPKPSFLHKLLSCIKKARGVLLFAVFFFAIFGTLFAIALTSASDRASSSATAAISGDDYAVTNGDLSGWYVEEIVYPDASFVPPWWNSSITPKITDCIQVELTWSDFVPATTGGTAKLYAHVILGDAFVGAWSFPPSSPYTFLLSLDTAKFIISPGSLSYDFTATLRLNSGSLLKFPFDEYKKRVSLLLGYSYNNTEGAMNFILKVDKSSAGLFSVSHATFGYSLDPKIVFPSFETTFVRPVVSQLFPMFLVVAFWIIPIAEFVMLSPYFFYKKFDNASYLSMAAALIFAVPSMRNSMPSAPPIGCLIDFASFFWCELFVVLMFVSSCIKIFIDYHRTPPATK